MRTFSPRPRGARPSSRSLIDITLDPAQQEAAQRPPGGAMLVLGEAGHGKTTVALHRLAYLYAKATGRFRAVVLVPSEGLRRLLQPLVTRLGADVTVMTYDTWAFRQARRAFGDLPKRASQTTSASVARIKRDPALRPILEELSARAPGLIDDDEDAPPVATLALAHRGDLQHLFGDRRLLERLVQTSKQGLFGHAVADVLEHTRVQFSLRSEEAHAHVDADRLVTVDARSIDQGTPDEDAETIDAEDCAVLFELDRLRAERSSSEPRKPRAYDCIVVDEAQEFAPLELALIGRSLASSATLVVAGDADQQIDLSACFGGWEATMREIGAQEYDTVTLEVGYRCPPRIAAFARAVRDGKSPVSAHIPLVRFDDERALTAWIAEEALELEARDPSAKICVVARLPQTASRIARALTGVVQRRLVLGGEFAPHRGIDVTTVEQVKGLEFDYVIVPDATARDYPEESASRRALYVAATRARYQLAMACAGEPSPLLGIGIGLGSAQ